MGKRRNSRSKLSFFTGLITILSAIGIVAYGIYKLFLKGNTADTEEESVDVEYTEVKDETEENVERQEIDVDAIIKKYKETMENGLNQKVDEEDLAPSDAEVEIDGFAEVENSSEQSQDDDMACIK